MASFNMKKELKTIYRNIKVDLGLSKMFNKKSPFKSLY